MAKKKYDDLSKEDLVRLLESRDRRDATRFGLVWEADEIERDKARNDDFVALDLDPALSCPPAAAAWKNLIIEGDNFDALRYLRMAFAGRVKCIYIDPPYNTGNKDFVYNDRFVDKEDLWRHSKWCEFMFQRLTLAKDLLRQDGSIFISIDDNEAPALGMMMRRIFGENGFVANCIWQKRYSRDNNSAIGDSHEYVMIFCRNIDAFKRVRNRLPLDAKSKAVYKNPNNDPRGPWRLIPMNGAGFRPNQMYEVTLPSGRVVKPPEGRHWSVLEPEFKQLRAEGKIQFGKDGNAQPGLIRYLDEVDGLVPWTWWPHDEVGHTDEAKKEIRAIFGTQTAFDTPKPVRLIERVIRIATEPDDIILDFFAGSGTTAHAAHKVNKGLNGDAPGNRRVILVSSTEATADEPNKNLCRDVCATRVRRVIEGYSDTPGLGGDFAYLRCRRIAPGKLTDIDHAQVWTALQLMHMPTLAAYEDGKTFAVADHDGQRLIYVPLLRAKDAGALAKAVAGSPATIVYSWQPDLAKKRLRAANNVQIEAVPESLARRFGIRL